jgi:uncharacterized coiled-coil DUF342 family protein
MLQMSKLVQSRNDWRNKAVARADEIREHRKTTKRHQETIAELKLQIKDLEQKLEAEKKCKPAGRASRRHTTGPSYADSLRAVDRGVDSIVS